jgi:light-regulated signal transduction histidine kinase (bacteriophytochrome)/CheY-like chemotaxis protein
VQHEEFRVDLTNCDQEPIHALGAIQDFGFLIAVSPEWVVKRVSANSGQFIGKSPEMLIGTALIDTFTAEAVHAMRNRMALLRGEDSVERLLGLTLMPDRPPFDVAIHVSERLIVIEAEPSPADPEGDATGMIRAMMARLNQAESVEAFYREGARQVRALTGFDRVMVYRFDESDSGEVVAEAVRAGLGSFLGLHYPASDIPAQARALYIRNMFRVIADIGSTPVAIVPALDDKGNPIDLSLSVLRSVSPIHIEYLTNMGVGASLSISIVIEGKLWGLFACHHYGPRLPSLERRSVCELFGQMFALKLESRERLATSEYLRSARDVADRLLGSLASDSSLLEDADLLAETIGKAIHSDGVAVCIEGKIATTGLGPPVDDIRALVRRLNVRGSVNLLAIDRIASIEPEAERYAEIAAGMLAIPISRVPRDYVLLFRQEIVRTVRWGGEPTKPVAFGPNGPRLTPRKSFEAWSELVRGSALPFTAAELRVAETLRATLIEVVLRMSHEAHAERQLANERQQLLIAELNHRVRNILSLIRGVIRQSDASGSTTDFVREVDNRIQALARAHNQVTAADWGSASLHMLIETESAAYLGDKAGRVMLNGPEIGLSPHGFAVLALVFHELITNSAKYGGLSDSGQIAVEWRLDDDGDLLIDWRENGGPPVESPSREGFGTTIINRSIPFDLGGKAEVHYHVTGVAAHFCIPAKHVRPTVPNATDTVDQAPATVDPAPEHQPLKGQCVLLVEDSLIVAMDAEDILHLLGAERVVAAANIRTATEELNREAIEIAILDVNLGDQTSLPIAEELVRRGIPFLFATGYGEQARFFPDMENVPIVQKPYQAAGIAKALEQLTGLGRWRSG